MLKIHFAAKCFAATAVAVMATLAHAEPFSLGAMCRLDSVIAGQGRCILEVSYQDTNLTSPTSIRRAQIRFDGLLAQQLTADTQNPVMLLTNMKLDVACGMSHSVTGKIMRHGQTTYEDAGAVSPTVCPAAP